MPSATSKHLPHYREGHISRRTAEFWLLLQDSSCWTVVLAQDDQSCHSMETLLMRSESEEANSKAQREKDVFFSAGQNTTFLAGTSRTVCPLWQYPACLDVHKCVFTCNPLWLHNLPPRELGKEDIWEALEPPSSLHHCISHSISSTVWSSWPLGKQPKKKPP